MYLFVFEEYDDKSKVTANAKDANDEEVDGRSVVDPRRNIWIRGSGPNVRRRHLVSLPRDDKLSLSFEIETSSLKLEK